MPIFSDPYAGQSHVPELFLRAVNGCRVCLSRRSKLAGRLSILLLVFGVSLSARAGQSLYLSWAPSPNPEVTGYIIYYGGSSGNYTNFVEAANVTNLCIPGLAGGTTYYFAGTSVDGSGEESGFSTEVSYTVPAARVNLAITSTIGGLFQLIGTGLAGHTYQIQATTNLVVWETIGTQALATTGPFEFTDSNAPTYPMRFYRVLDAQP